MTPEARAMAMQMLAQVADLINQDEQEEQAGGEGQGGAAAAPAAPEAAAPPAAGAAQKEASVEIPVLTPTPVDAPAPVMAFITDFMMQRKKEVGTK